MRCNACLMKAKKCAQRTRVRTHVKKVQLVEVQLHRDSANEEVRDILSNLQGKLAEVFQDFVLRNQHLSSASWHKYEDTCSKAFFDFHRIGKKKALLRELETESGTISGQINLSQYITDFYKHLYSLDALAPDIIEAQQ